MQRWIKLMVLSLLGLLLLALPGAFAQTEVSATAQARSYLNIEEDLALDAEQTISWLDYTTTMNEGRFQNKNIMLFFTTVGDPWCDKLQMKTLSDPKVIAYLNTYFISCKIDRERFPILAKKYKIDAMPALWFLDPKGKGLTSTDGFMPARQMLLVLEFIQEEIYKETTFKQWKESRFHK